ncbi:AciT family ciprofloxacin tolerance protein [uncultured Psychrobacter sp.]|uniref:AciT family ciprofloxacin tolerance protein n=1 Tax=uncultured Psychrobacter sp. TaxID=259303 RepID=UPI00263815E7|nr:AciT family ciprofloxacin tolerance protein [uncultured Psychrobacter sp.]
MMFLTIFSVAGVDTLGGSALLGYGLLASFIIAIAFTSQRWLLWYMLGGMIYWLSVEVLHSALMSGFGLSDWHSYVVAFGISWLPLAGWVLYRALRYDDVSRTVQQERERAAARYVEHTPIYDDHYQPRF